MLTDQIADMLIRIKSAYLAGKASVEFPRSKMKHRIAGILVEHGYLTSVSVREEGKKEFLVVKLRYQDGVAALENIERVSKPGRRAYAGYTELDRVFGGFGILIVSTSSGVMTGEKARKSRLGGEVLARVW